MASQIVIAQEWEESERGWGVRPDGYTLHLSMEDCARFREEFWRNQRAICGAGVPAEYTRECGEPVAVSVSSETAEIVAQARAESRYGVWGEGRSLRSNGAPSARPN